MKNKIFLIAIVVSFLSGCHSADRQMASSDNDIDAARNFIRSALDGDFEKAGLYMVRDSMNTEDLNAIERLNERNTPDEKAKYKEASIHIYETRKINDSASVIYYANSYKNKKDSLKVIKMNDKWLVDFKYIFKHRSDSLQQ